MGMGLLAPCALHPNSSLTHGLAEATGDLAEPGMGRMDISSMEYLLHALVPATVTKTGD